ncbi:hypothetical protein [Streptomyces canus]|uniref:hypothetical protein n=1 Tax=Streptomyces canus TaxID=58343 RepID=UPI0033A2D892
MRTYRYKVQTSSYGLFLGITAEAIQLNAPPTSGNQVSDRVWLDTGRVHHAYSGRKLALNGQEVTWLHLGLREYTESIELGAPGSYVLIIIHALEVVDADYAEAALAPALAKWTEAEFGLAPRSGRINRDSTTGELTFSWDERPQ